MTKLLLPKQSELDYLWENYGNRGMITSTDSEDPDAIPSFGVVKDLFDKLSALGVGSVKKEGTSIVIKSIDGDYMNEIPLTENGSVEIPSAIAKFSKRFITLKDIDEGSPYLLFQPVYSIILDNGYEFVAPIDVYEGNSDGLIETKVVKNTIYTDLKIDRVILGVEFLTTDRGLAGKIYLEGSTKGIHFSLVSEGEYASIPHDSTTLYIIRDANYMYFGDTKIGTSKEVEDILEKLLKEVDRKFEEVDNKYKELKETIQGLEELEGLEELKKEIDDITDYLTWKEIY